MVGAFRVAIVGGASVATSVGPKAKRKRKVAVEIRRLARMLSLDRDRQIALDQADGLDTEEVALERRRVREEEETKAAGSGEAVPTGD
jgi:hypothetical protein